jgi:hypothetical protein
MAARLELGDLRAPVLTPEQAELLRAAEADPVELTEAALLGTAVERTGLDDFGPDDFRERVALVLDELGSDENATEYAKAAVFRRLARALTTRLLTVEFLRTHPEAHEVRIERPIVVTGLLRSGTTHLLNLLAADRRFQSLAYWQALEPVPVPGEATGADGVDPRYARCEQVWLEQQRMNPLQAAHHHMGPDDIQEDIYLQLPDVASYILELAYTAPRWREHYLAHDQTPHYAYARTALQALQLQSGADGRWVLKAPQHLEQLGPLLAVYPDALVVFTHRDPVAALQSLITMRSYMARMREKQIDIDAIVDDSLQLVDRLVAAYLRDIDAVPEAQRVDVPFAELTADDLGTVARVHDAAGVPTTPGAQADLAAYAAEHRRGRLGRIDFDIRRDFGLDPAELRSRYGAYLERHPIAVEAA